MRFRIARKLHYLKKARYRHGHGIHSPFLFRLITDVIENKKRLPAYKILRDQRDRLSDFIKQEKGRSGIQTFSDSILISSGRRNLFKAVELPLRYGKLLFRLINEFNPKNISCFGPTFGLNLLYFALSDNSTPVNFFQADNYLQPIIQETLKDAEVQNVKPRSWETPLNEFADFIFINFPFSPVETDSLIKAQLVSNGDNEVIIIRGIHESGQMESIWNDLIKNNKVRVSLDLFEIGIILFRKNLQKENFIFKY